jgi:hypothetical protein
VALADEEDEAVYPSPPGLDFNDAEQVNVFVQSLPLGAFLFVLLGWVLATLLVGWLAAYIARTRPLLFGGIVGAVVLCASIADLLLISHPVWFSITAIVAIPVTAFLASRLVAPRHAA